MLRNSTHMSIMSRALTPTDRMVGGKLLIYNRHSVVMCEQFKDVCQCVTESFQIADGNLTHQISGAVGEPANKRARYGPTSSCEENLDAVNFE